MNVSYTLKGIMDVLNNPVVEPYSTEKVNGKNGSVEKIHIIPTCTGGIPYSYVQ